MIATRFAGIQNTVSARDLPAPVYSDSGIAMGLQDAVDVDITNAGGIVVRPGYQLARSVPISAAYTTLDDVTYIVSEGRLKRVNSDLTLTDLAATTATNFADYQRYLFTNDGLSVFDEHLHDYNIPTPTEPEVVITGGNLPAGQYNIVTTFVNADGLEGGTSPIVAITLETPNDIIVTPQTVAGYTSKVYMTNAGGEVFYDLQSGKQITPSQVNANPFPARADQLEFYNTRLYVTERWEGHTVVWASKPYQYHLYGVDDGYFIVPGQVLGMKSVPQGLIIGTDAAIYVYTDGRLEELATYGVVPGRPIVKTPNGTVLIHTVRGVCSALPFQAITEDTVSLYMGATVSTHIMYQNGIRKYVALHDAGTTPFNAFTN